MRRQTISTALVLTLIMLALVLSIVPGLAQSGGTIDVRRNVIAGGGATSTGSGNKQISGTGGQAAAGAQSSGGTLVEKSGFWHAAVAPAATPTPTPEVGPGRFVFNAATYNVNEACTEATVTVQRIDGSSVAATVDYNVTNGTGYTPCNINAGMGAQNCDFSFTTGTLSFGVGETSKTFGVLISKDAYVEGNELLNLSLGNATASATIGVQGTAAVSVIDNAAVPAGSQPIDEPSTFVGQHFHDFLSRSPDPGGQAFWEGQITQCGGDQSCILASRINVSNAFFYELEYQQTGSYVFRLYRAAFGDDQPFPNPDLSNLSQAKKIPGYAAFLPDRSRVIGGGNLAQSQLDLANAFVSRPEFLTRYPASLNAAQSFITAVLQTIQASDGVDLSSQMSALTNLYNSGGRGAVMYRLADDNAGNPLANQSFVNAEYNRAFVTTQYFGYLRRDADIGGLLFWLSQVNSAPLKDVNRQHEMVCSFITSAEYQLRFSAVVTHSNGECSH